MRKETPERVYEDVNLQDIIKQTGKQLTGGKRKNNSIANQVYLLNKKHIDQYGNETPNIKSNSARKTGGAALGAEDNAELGTQGASFDLLSTQDMENQIKDLETAQSALNTADMVVGSIPIVGDILSAGIGIANLIMGDETARREKEIEEKQKENDRLLDSYYSWKGNMENQIILTLSTQEDPTIYSKMKKNALDMYRTMDPNKTPSTREVKAFEKTIDDERNGIIATRKAITDQMAQNSQDILGVIADTLQTEDEEKTEIIDDGFKERTAIITAFTSKLKEYISKFLKEEEQLDEVDAKAQEQVDAVSKIIDEKEAQLEENAKEVSQLKGYSGCNSTSKTNQEMRDDALEQVKAEQQQLEEDQAQGKVPMEGLGKRYKKYNKNSIANQIHLMNMRYIKTF
jgi:hypothetical protein